MKKIFFAFSIILGICVNSYGIDNNKYSRIAYRIAMRAQIINERIKSITADDSTRIKNLYYYILGALEDSNGLFQLGDYQNSREKLVVIDTITYDIVCAGVSAAVELNKETANFQKSKNAANMKEYKEVVEKNMGIVDRNGLLQSVKFTLSEEKIYSAIANTIYTQSLSIGENLTGDQIKNLLCSTDLVESKNVFFKLPAMADPTAIKYIFGLTIDKQWGITPQLYINGNKLSKSMFLMILFNVYAYYEGLGAHNNDSLESQIHYLLSQMRIADFLIKNKTLLGIKNSQDIEEYMQVYKSSYERLVEESFPPSYYDNILKIREFAGAVDKVNFSWMVQSQNESTINEAMVDDYLFFLEGNGSQMPPNTRLVEFIEKYVPEKIHSGTAFDLGSGDGRNSLFLAKQKKLFHRVVAVDHSKAAITRIKRLPDLEPDILDIIPVCENILNYKLPGEDSPLLQRPNFILLDNVVEFLPDQNRIPFFSKLKKALLPGGIIFIEYHIASGEKFEKIKESDNYIVKNNTVNSINKFRKNQKKHFFKKNELESELSKAGISQKEGFVIKSKYFTGKDKEFEFGLIIVEKVSGEKN